ncbi:hypothetical protein Baya_12150 [Bagarius yarrelli]|uniref:Uncharacterized protein n=1 Tax=Bagarius yarrelli TaxID=175774 RepID=A0A556V219_BAGYA|nr:hypothetical protein Baya_12150 [Bagarius yarrelli]
MNSSQCLSKPPKNTELHCLSDTPKSPGFSGYSRYFVALGFQPRQHKDRQTLVSGPVTTEANPAHVYARVMTAFSPCMWRLECSQHQSGGVNKADFDPD